LKDDADIAVRRLGEQRLVICAAPQYLDRYGTPKDKGELLTHNCIAGLQRGQRAAWLLRNAAGEFELTPVPARHEWGDGEAMLNAAVAGCGVAQLPTWLVGDHLRRGELVEILSEWSGGEMPVHVIWPRTKYVQPRVRVVIDELVRLSSEDGSGFKP
jgi:DNA-binding transcriptional LysR family regulator